LIGPARPRLSGEVRRDLFAGPPPAVRHAPAVVPKPEAPAFPYRYAGRFEERGGAPRMFLQKGNELVAIEQGEMLDGAWRIDAVSAERIDVTFVPGEQQLSMTLASLAGPAPQQAAPAPFVRIAPFTPSASAGPGPQAPQQGLRIRP
jgi:hypothetical protein